MTANVVVRDEAVEVWDGRVRLHVKVAGDGPPRSPKNEARNAAYGAGSPIARCAAWSYRKSRAVAHVSAPRRSIAARDVASSP